MKAIIMGATSGIGLEVAKILNGQGYELGIAGRREENLREIKESLSNVKAYMPIDITAADAPEKLGSLIEQLGGMDLYFHSSGIGYQNKELDPSMDAVDRMIYLNHGAENDRNQLRRTDKGDQYRIPVFLSREQERTDRCHHLHRKDQRHRTGTRLLRHEKVPKHLCASLGTISDYPQGGHLLHGNPTRLRRHRLAEAQIPDVAEARSSGAKNREGHPPEKESRHHRLEIQAPRIRMADDTELVLGTMGLDQTRKVKP